MCSSRKKIILFFGFFFLFLIFTFSTFSQSTSEQPLVADLLVKYSFGIEERDPFSPLVSKSGLILIPREIDITDLVFRGIIYSQEEPIAIINDQVLKKGDSIGKYTILEIKEKEVLLKKGNEGFTLKLEEQ